MTGELTIFKTGTVASTVFAGVQLPTQRLDDGIAAGFAKVSYKGGKWGIKYQGQYTPVQARLPGGTLIPSPFLDVVMLKTSSHPAKAWYEGVYQEGDAAPPDCWSTNGITPDIGVPNKQCNTCIGCQWNVWGSKINRDTGMATRGKACTDSKRVAVVPVGDIENTMYGGPMMLSIPPTSLKRLGPYQNTLEANGFHYATVWTRISFEQQSAYPLMIFDAMSALNDVQAQQVLKMIEHPLVDRILEAEMQAAEAWDEALRDTHATQPTQPVQPQPQPQPQPQRPQPVQQPAHQTGVVIAMPARPGQVLDPNDPGPIPEALQRPRPGDDAQPVEAEVVQPAQTQPGGMTLPLGMTAEMAAAFLAQFSGTQAQPAAPAQTVAPAAGRGRGRPPKPRTPPVSPAPADTSQQANTAPQESMVMGNPQPAGPPNGQTNGAGPVVMVTGSVANDPAVSQIMGTLKKLV